MITSTFCVSDNTMTSERKMVSNVQSAWCSTRFIVDLLPHDWWPKLNQRVSSVWGDLLRTSGSRWSEQLGISTTSSTAYVNAWMSWLSRDDFAGGDWRSFLMLGIYYICFSLKMVCKLSVHKSDMLTLKSTS